MAAVLIWETGKGGATTTHRIRAGVGRKEPRKCKIRRQRERTTCIWKYVSARDSFTLITLVGCPRRRRRDVDLSQGLIMYMPRLQRSLDGLPLKENLNFLVVDPREDLVSG